MPTPSQTILADIVRLGNSPIGEKTVPDLQALLAKVLDYADSLTAKGTTVDDLADFQETLDDLTGVADTLDAACDAYDMAEDEDAREEALEAAGEALADLAAPLQDIDSIAEYIPTTEADVAYIVPRVLELTYTAHNLKPWSEDLGHHGPPFAFDPVRRAQLRAELDAKYARMYGLTRDELRYILDPADTHGPDYPTETFRGLKSNELRAFGEYRTRRLVLEAWDAQQNP